MPGFLIALWERMKNEKWLACIIGCLLFLLLVAGVYVLWQTYFLPPTQKATYLPQTEAETIPGVEKAAKNAGVPLTAKQKEDIAKQIAVASTSVPDAVIKTTIKDLPAEIDEARKSAGADFAIITDACRSEVVNPTKESAATEPIIRLKRPPPANLSFDTPVAVNQYNIQAYKERLTVVNLGVRTASLARVKKVHIPPIPIFAPKGATGYSGAFIGILHQGYRKIDGIEAGLTLIF